MDRTGSLALQGVCVSEKDEAEKSNVNMHAESLHLLLVVVYLVNIRLVLM